MRHIEILTYTLLCLGTSFEIPNFKSRHFLHRDMKCGMICLSHTAQLPVLNEHKRSPKISCIKQHFIQHFLSWLLLKSLILPIVPSYHKNLKITRCIFKYHVCLFLICEHDHPIDLEKGGSC